MILTGPDDLPSEYRAQWVSILRAHELLSAFRDSSNGVLFWRAYLARRKGGANALADFDPFFLAVLDEMAELVLEARTNDEVAAAVMLDRPAGGGPGPEALQRADFEAFEIASAVWECQARAEGLTSRDGAAWDAFFRAPPPRRLRHGVPEAAMAEFARRHPDAEARPKAAFMQVWQRYKTRWAAADDASRAQMLAATFAALSRKDNA